MFFKSFLSKLWNSIKSLFGSFPADLKDAIHIGAVVTENIKNFVESPAADILTALIPGTIDDAMKTILRAKLPNLLISLKLADNCGSLSDPAEITACAIKVLQSMEGDIKSAFLHNLSVLVAQAAADGKLSWSDGVYLLEWYYQNKYKRAA